MTICAATDCENECPPRKGPGKHPKWCSDYCRKKKYRRVCPDCGGWMDGASGFDRLSKRCAMCERHRNDERTERLIEMWEDGSGSPEIAADLGMTPRAVLSQINELRQRHGWDLTLHRRRDRELWPEIERRWNAGETGPEIAAALGSTTFGIYEMVRAMRAKGVELPVRRHNQPIGSVEQIRELWDQGLTLKGIAEEIGYSSATSLANRITALRDAGHDIPYRRPPRRVRA